jgi:hypothetical protein
MVKVQRFGFTPGKRQTGGAVVTVAELDGSRGNVNPGQRCRFQIAGNE